MSDRKTFDSPGNPDQQMVILQNRRMNNVKKNFAVGGQRITAGKSTGKGLRLNSRKN